MAKLLTFIDVEKLPRILNLTVEFDNGKVLDFEAAQIGKMDIFQWLGPEEPTLVGEVRFVFLAELLGLELEVPNVKQN